MAGCATPLAALALVRLASLASFAHRSPIQRGAHTGASLPADVLTRLNRECRELQQAACTDAHTISSSEFLDVLCPALLTADDEEWHGCMEQMCGWLDASRSHCQALGEAFTLSSLPTGARSTLVHATVASGGLGWLARRHRSPGATSCAYDYLLRAWASASRDPLRVGSDLLGSLGLASMVCVGSALDAAGAVMEIERVHPTLRELSGGMTMLLQALEGTSLEGQPLSGLTSAAVLALREGLGVGSSGDSASEN